MKIKDDFKYFEFLKSEGTPAEQAYLETKKVQLDYFTALRMLRKIYGLSLVEAKKIIIIAEGLTQNPDKNPKDILNQYEEDLLKTLDIFTKLVDAK